MSFSPIELLGLSASVVIFISFIFKDVKWIRILNAVGSFIFVIYGIQIGSLSVTVLNGGALLVNIYHLIRLHHERRDVTKGGEDNE